MQSNVVPFSSERMVDDDAETMVVKPEDAGFAAPLGAPPPPQDALTALAEEEQSEAKNPPPEYAEEGTLPLTPEAITDTTPIVSTFKDHFTLQLPSSVIRYRNLHSAARILEAPDAQFVLEDLYDPDQKTRHVSIRRLHDTSEGVRALRLLYAIVTAFWTGFLFIFCLQILLFLFLDVAIQSGATKSQDPNWYRAIGAILAFPGFVYSLASALVIAGVYIQDCWNGHYLIRNFTFKGLSSSTVEWIFFSFFLGLPILVMCISLLTGSDEWWQTTTFVWFASIVAFYCLFTMNIIFYELHACWTVTKNKNHKASDSWIQLICRSMLARQIHRYSGRATTTYLAKGSITDSEYTDSDTSKRNMLESTLETSENWPTRLTRWKKLKDWRLYKDCKYHEEQLYSIEDARDVRPFVTSHTWSLEKIFCRPANSRYIAIIRGPGALTAAQLRSSFACSILGTFLMFFVFSSGLMYLKMGLTFTLFMVVLAAAAVWPRLRGTYKLYKTRHDLSQGIVRRSGAHADAGSQLEDNRDHQEESECVYQVQETFRVTKPTRLFCHIMFGLEVAILYVYPLTALFWFGNYPLGIMFGLFAGITAFRYYVNAAVVLEEVGHMDLVDGKTEREIWQNQSRLNEIIGNITRGRSLGAWISVLASTGIVFLAMMLGAVGSGTEVTLADSPAKVFAPDFEYIQRDSLRYPSCRLSSKIGGATLDTMADYVFMAGIAYSGRNATETELDNWFGEGKARDETDQVEEIRDALNITSAVKFKLFSFPETNTAYVSIRGTTNNWDMLTDAQLWSAAALMQLLREMLPFGNMWSPVIDQLIMVMTKIESASIEKVSFYRDTTKFVNFLKANGTYDGLGITGHSLGGGLAMITGAQTEVPAVAISGPNAMLSRLSFDPPVTAELLNSKTFNIIPDRDIVPMIDDKAQNWQGIRCETELIDVVGCHTSVRTLCEILFSCGSNDRPVPCQCVTRFGYEEPQAKAGTNRTFLEACAMDPYLETYLAGEL